MSRSFRTSPILAGLALVAMGAALRRWRPDALSLPRPPKPEEAFGGSGWRGTARKARDGVVSAMPENLTVSLGRALMLMGAGLIVARALDEIVEDDHALF